MAGNDVPYTDRVLTLFKGVDGRRLRTSADSAYRSPVDKQPPDDQLPRTGQRSRRQWLIGEDGVRVLVDHRNGAVIHVRAVGGDE